jgi:pyruvate dehydrogenase E2 component (dihydrolipoamide acetyltransferase)
MKGSLMLGKGRGIALLASENYNTKSLRLYKNSCRRQALHGRCPKHEIRCMAMAITIPRLGWTMEEGIFAGWLKQDGEAVQAGDRLFTLESDKATEDIEALDSGVLHVSPDGPRPGDTIRVGSVIGVLLQPGEIATEMPKQSGAAPGHESSLAFAFPAAPTEELSGLSQLAVPAISPRALRIAAELGVDWMKLRGSGKTGRIRECDVRAASGPDAIIPPDAVLPADDEEKRRVRQRIAKHVVQSVQSTAPVTLTTTADATNLVHLREQFQGVGRSGSEPIPSYTDFILKLAALALQQHPYLNARWEEDRVVLQPAIHIGIAVDTDAGLLAPVIHDVPGLSLRRLAACTRDLIQRARQRNLHGSEMQGGTFTVSNLGAFDIDAFTPIIHFPQCAILGIGRIQRQPFVFQDQITVRERITLSLTFDHRIVDGAPAARFLQSLMALIENPGPALIG